MRAPCASRAWPLPMWRGSSERQLPSPTRVASRSTGQRVRVAYSWKRSKNAQMMVVALIWKVVGPVTAAISWLNLLPGQA